MRPGREIVIPIEQPKPARPAALPQVGSVSHTGGEGVYRGIFEEKIGQRPESVSLEEAVRRINAKPAP